MSVKPQNKPIFFQPSTIETIDTAMYSWFDKELNLFCDTNKGFRKVPVIWVGGERSAQIKKDQFIRDSESTLILPRITIERKDFDKAPANRSYFVNHLYPTNDYKGSTFPAFRTINQLKTSNFANAQAKRTVNNVGKGQLNFKTKKQHPVVYTTYSTPLPVFLVINYEISVWTEYQQQMNQIMQPILIKTGHISNFFITHDNHIYECFFEDSFPQQNNISNLNDEERKFESKFSVRCLGYLIGGDKNEKFPSFTKRENAVQFTIGRERTVLDED